MPTEKPRITFALDEDVLERLNDYKFQHRYKNQSQAIIALIETGLKKINAPTEQLMEDSSDQVAATPTKLKESIAALSERLSAAAAPVSVLDDDSARVLSFASKFHSLDEHGRRVVEAVLDLELERCADQHLENRGS